MHSPQQHLGGMCICLRIYMYMSRIERAALIYIRMLLCMRMRMLLCMCMRMLLCMCMRMLLCMRMRMLLRMCMRMRMHGG